MLFPVLYQMIQSFKSNGIKMVKNNGTAILILKLVSVESTDFGTFPKYRPYLTCKGHK